MRLEDCEYKKFSQNGEDGVIAELTKNAARKVFVEIGAADNENNTLALEASGWRGIRLDASKGEWVTALNAPLMLVERGIWPYGPNSPSFLSIDIDGQDYWVWKSLMEAGYLPDVVCIEYNAWLGYMSSRVVPLDDKWHWDATTEYFGASLLALAKLGSRFGYRLAYCETAGVNAFFTKQDRYVASAIVHRDVRMNYRPRRIAFVAPYAPEWEEV